MKAKALTLVGTRPELIRLSRLIPRMDETFEHTFVYTGQNADPNLSDVFITEMGIRDPDYRLDLGQGNFVKSMAKIFEGVDDIISNTKPDFAVVLGDTNSALSAIVCERRGVPVYHLEAGNRSFDANVPEEINRKAIDHTASFNLSYTPGAKQNLLREGLHPRTLSISGSPLREVFDYYKPQIDKSDVLSEVGVTEGDYLVLSMHRQENVDSVPEFKKVLITINEIAKSYGLKVVMTVHPRIAGSIGGIESELTSFILCKPLGYLDFMKLQIAARAVISDSGSVSEESAIAGFRAITPRNSMERPEAIETGAMILAGLTARSMGDALGEVLKTSQNITLVPEGYEVRDFSTRVVKFILSSYHLVPYWRHQY